ncbi:peptidase M42 [Marinicauda pacifica]|uniref:M42 family peptidase n=1 Tax=Marinicauda pacifica TaxID=1133559 RepID=A0A4S2HDN8_9PROT|nr:M42 family metallopeptidase [Marinicauda pacifica]TGY94160.1 hypothetical protein E5162_02450 [Marinicauda pacifica]GGE33428.1 peptidase M42 [Marinicauda pacifica]
MSAPDVLSARILAKTNEYLDFPSVVGHETPFLDHLARDFESLGHTVHRPRNLCVVELGDGPVMLAHVDRHGGVVDGGGAIIYAAHAIKNDKYGEQAPASADLAAKVRERYVGEEVFAYDRLTGGRIAYGTIDGVEQNPDGHIRLDVPDLPALDAGTPVAFARRLERGNAYVVGQLDNPVSAAVLRVCAEQGLTGTLVFTAEEEIGRSAEHFLGWADASLKTRQDLLVLDTTPFDDGAISQAGAVVLRRRDATADFNDAMYDRLHAAAKACNAPIITKCEYIIAENAAREAQGLAAKSLGLTELGKITARSKGAFAGTTLQVPTFNYHSNQESTTPQALVAYARTLIAASNARP